MWDDLAPTSLLQYLTEYMYWAAALALYDTPYSIARRLTDRQFEKQGVEVKI